MSTEFMSDYEARAWADAVERLNRQRESKVRQKVRNVTGPARDAAGKAWSSVPGNEKLAKQVLKASDGMKAVTFDPALRSVDARKALARHGVASPDELRALDLRDVDRTRRGVRTLYTGMAMAEGGGSALAVTGSAISATVSGGVTASVAAAAIAADAVTSLALMGRVIGVVAAEYGYDVRLPEEEAFALGVMTLGAATTAAEKTAALTSLRRLAAQMMRQPTWAQLNRHALVKLIDRVFAQLGEKLTKQKLGQAVPVAGVFINAGLSAHMTDTTFRAARDIYRVRFLSDKYGIDPRSWSAGAPEDVPSESPDDLFGGALVEALGGNDSDLLDEPDPQFASLEEVRDRD